MDILSILLVLLPLIAVTTQKPMNQLPPKEEVSLRLSPSDFEPIDFNLTSNFTDDAVTYTFNNLRDRRSIDNLIDFDLLKSQFKSPAEFEDFKIRLIRFTQGLATQENLYLLRRFLFYLSKVSNFIAKFLPQQPSGIRQEIPMPDVQTEQVSINNSAGANQSVKMNQTKSQVVKQVPGFISNGEGNDDGQDKVSGKLVERYLDSLNLWRNMLDEDYVKLW